ncbi:hypothetical protein [Proteus mirabilis]|uniref:hypothetical protein n=1 Tax=Proteus mirabilis TaxID=584 RepID=UPI0022826511|nr:hypothetical protein [Proteus mirabilis]MCY9777874.1 hypothetical protein [Proteus mirabilis]MCY9779932.1 hypothetical protein [Proteus mirabilis]MCY9788589.1 hypothetical protein [Proteus mirabilis]MDC5880712.1 hypothetical protein [Proteus mirabilis]
MDINKYDRALQLDILTALYDSFPNPLEDDEYEELSKKFSNKDHLIANMLYLEMHGLIEKPFIQSSTLDGIEYIFNSYTCFITEKGIDFLLDDGGLSAILKVQTIRIHSDSIKALEDIILTSNESPDMKANLRSKLHELPANAITHLMNELLVKGVMNLPVAIQIIQKFLQ